LLDLFDSNPLRWALNRFLVSKLGSQIILRIMQALLRDVFFEIVLRIQSIL
jgi:hypothetical protein